MARGDNFLKQHSERRREERDIASHQTKQELKWQCGGVLIVSSLLWCMKGKRKRETPREGLFIVVNKYTEKSQLEERGEGRIREDHRGF